MLYQVYFKLSFHFSLQLGPTVWLYSFIIVTSAPYTYFAGESPILSGCALVILRNAIDSKELKTNSSHLYLKMDWGVKCDQKNLLSSILFANGIWGLDS